MYSFAFSSTRAAVSHEASKLNNDTPGPAHGCFSREGADPEYEGHYSKQVLDCISQLAPPLRLATMTFLAARKCAAQQDRGIHRATGRRRVLSLPQCQGSEGKSDRGFQRCAELLCAELPANVAYAGPARAACRDQGSSTPGGEGATRVLDRRRVRAVNGWMPRSLKTIVNQKRAASGSRPVQVLAQEILLFAGGDIAPPQHVAPPEHVASPQHVGAP